MFKWISDFRYPEDCSVVALTPWPDVMQITAEFFVAADPRFVSLDAPEPAPGVIVTFTVSNGSARYRLREQGARGAWTADRLEPGP